MNLLANKISGPNADVALTKKRLKYLLNNKSNNEFSL